MQPTVESTNNPSTIILELKQKSKIENGRAKLLIEASRVYTNGNKEYISIGSVTVTCATKSNLNKRKVKANSSGKTYTTVASVTRNTVCKARSKLGRKENRTIARSKRLKLTL